MENLKAGDRVRLIEDKSAVGTIDETWFENGEKQAAVVWDISGCVGDGPLDELELIPNE